MSESTFCHAATTGAVHGIVPVVPTPFHEDGCVDFESLERLIDFASDSGVTGVSLPAAAGQTAFLENPASPTPVSDAENVYTFFPNERTRGQWTASAFRELLHRGDSAFEG